MKTGDGGPFVVEQRRTLIFQPTFVVLDRTKCVVARCQREPDAHRIVGLLNLATPSHATAGRVDAAMADLAELAERVHALRNRIAMENARRRAHRSPANAPTSTASDASYTLKQIADVLDRLEQDAK